MAAQTEAHLGRFKLGEATLGASVGHALLFDTISITDSHSLTVEIAVSDIITISELLAILVQIAETDTISITDGGSFPVFAWAGIDGRIIQLLDITSDDFCAMIEEGGQSIVINDVTEQAFFQIQQRTRRYDREIEVDPGDAIMYACPELTTEDDITEKQRFIEVNDQVIFENITYTIVAIKNYHIDGNVIARECACKVDAVAPSAPINVR